MLRCSTDTTVDHVKAFDGINVDFVQSVCTHTLVLQPIMHMYKCNACIAVTGGECACKRLVPVSTALARHVCLFAAACHV